MSDVKWTPFNPAEGDEEHSEPHFVEEVNVGDFEPEPPKVTKRPRQPQGPDGKFLKTGGKRSRPYVSKKLLKRQAAEKVAEEAAKKAGLIIQKTPQPDQGQSQRETLRKLLAGVLVLLSVSLLVQIATLLSVAHFFF